jgi:hypothetical protein
MSSAMLLSLSLPPRSKASNWGFFGFHGPFKLTGQLLIFFMVSHSNDGFVSHLSQIAQALAHKLSDLIFAFLRDYSLLYLLDFLLSVAFLEVLFVLKVTHL